MRLGINGRFLCARPTGVQRFAYEVTTRLCERRDTTVLVPSNHTGAGVTGARLKRGRLGGVFWEQLELPGAARRAGVDVLLHLANACPRFGGPHVQLLHDLTPLTRPEDFHAVYRLWVRWAHVAPARSAAGLLTVSEHARSEIARATGISPDRMRIVRQGAGPLDTPADAETVVAVRARHRIPERYFLAMGVGDRRKGLDFLRDVYSRWSVERGRDVALVVVGDSYERVHRDVPDHSALLALGHVPDEDLRALYTGSLAFLFPSVEEGFGRSPLEALACGTRVVVAPYPAAAEVLGDGADLVRREIDDWVRALDAICAEPSQRRSERIARGREWAADFTWEQATEEILSVCVEVAEARVPNVGTNP